MKFWSLLYIFSCKCSIQYIYINKKISSFLLNDSLKLEVERFLGLFLECRILFWQKQLSIQSMYLIQPVMEITLNVNQCLFIIGRILYKIQSSVFYICTKCFNRWFIRAFWKRYSLVRTFRAYKYFISVNIQLTLKHASHPFEIQQLKFLRIC